MKQFGSGGPMGGSMADIEAQLEELSSSELSGTAGGVMTYFLWWDLGVFVLLVRPRPPPIPCHPPQKHSGVQRFITSFRSRAVWSLCHLAGRPFQVV